MPSGDIHGRDRACLEEWRRQQDGEIMDTGQDEHSKHVYWFISVCYSMVLLLCISAVIPYTSLTDSICFIHEALPRALIRDLFRLLPVGYIRLRLGALPAGSSHPSRIYTRFRQFSPVPRLNYRLLDRDTPRIRRSWCFCPGKIRLAAVPIVHTRI